MTDEQAAKAKNDPASVYSNPEAVLVDDTVSPQAKIEILKSWEYDAREMQVADEEGFPARPPDGLLDAIIAALHELGSGPDLEHSPTTKQGGV